jgi:type II secretory pathway pseudopilin PulG
MWNIDVKKLRLLERGFSLGETLLGLGLLAILVIITAPKIVEIRANQLVQNESRSVVAALERFATYAVLQEIPITVSLTTKTIAIKGPSSVLWEEVLPEGLLFHSTRPLPLQLSFYPTGVASPRSFSITNSKTLCKITISLRSHVTLVCTK